MLNGTEARDVAIRMAGVLSQFPTVKIETRFLDFSLETEEAADGSRELWTQVTTRPAFEICFISLLPHDTRVILIRKRRKATDTPRIKLPGGYVWGPEPAGIYYQKKVYTDTGIVFSAADIRPLGHVIGHSEIRTPIDLFWTDRWSINGSHREGIEVFEVTLQRAVEMAINHEVENDSSFSAIMRLNHYIAEGII